MRWHHVTFHRGVLENSCGDASEDVGLVLGTSVSTHDDQVTSQFVSQVDDVRCSLPPCNRSFTSVTPASCARWTTLSTIACASESSAISIALVSAGSLIFPRPSEGGRAQSSSAFTIAILSGIC